MSPTTLFAASCRLLAALGAALLVVGCAAQDHPFPELHPVQGKVLRGGKAVAGGHVEVLGQSLQDAMIVVNGPVKEDGAFELTTVSGKVKKRLPGAPLGSYRVLYTAPGDGQMVVVHELPGPFTVEAKANQWVVALKK